MKEILGRVSGGGDLTMEEMTSVIDTIMRGQSSEEEIGLLLTALRAKGETVDEVAGAAAAMRKHMTRISSSGGALVDTCGTGGSGKGTFNISTAAALVGAAAGIRVAKHGNRAMSSQTGSADVLAELGVNVEAPVEVVERCLDELGICFCFAQLLHGSMKHVAPVRKKLGVRTIFNLLGPLCNPAGAPYQVLGVGSPELRELLAGALARLGTERSLVLHGEDGLGEVTLAGRTQVTEVRRGDLTNFQWTPQDFGIQAAEHQRAVLDSLLADGPTQSAAIIREVLDGQPGAARDIVVINAAAALWVAGSEPSLEACARQAAQAIDTGAARQLLQRLAEVSNS